MRHTLWTGIVAVFLSPGIASASYVDAKLTSVSPGVNMTIYESSNYSGGVGTTAGNFNWSQSNNSYLQSTFSTFCIEIGQSVGIGNTILYRLDNQIQNHPTPGTGAGQGGNTSGGMGTVKANFLRELYGRYYGTLGSDNINNAAFQLAIWEITHDGYLTASSGQYYYSDNAIGTGSFQMRTTDGNAGSARTIANGWLASLDGKGKKYDNLVVLTSSGAQDQITVMAAPAPPAIGLAVVGAIAMFGLKRNRRKSKSSEQLVK